MDKEKAIDSNIIDEYFGEKMQKNHDNYENNSDNQEFLKKLDSAMAYMNKLNIEKVEAAALIENIFTLADQINQKKKQKKDILIFTFIGGILLFIVMLTAYIFGSRVIFYFQLIIWTNIPLLIIPLIYKSEKGGKIV